MEKSLKRNSKHFVYIVQCQDGTYYTGYTNNIEARIKRHNTGFASKYTRSRLPVGLVWSKRYDYLCYAMRAEKKIKQLSRRQKQLLIGGMRLDKVLGRRKK